MTYNVIIFITVVLAIYLGSFYLVKAQKISLLKHRRFWNYSLLAFFLISAILGLTLAIFIDYNLNTSWYGNILWLHVEAGIVMATISIFHIIWHFRYFLPKKIKKEE